MMGRNPGEPHRSATSLELLFDLCFVVAVAQASTSLREALTEGDYTGGGLRFALVFFTIWWAWMNFTWFASAYDPDDVPYRLTVLVQITGSLVLAAGVRRAFEDGDLYVITLGYVVLRTALAALWLRAALSDPARRSTTLRFAVGVSVCQLGWVGLLLVPVPARLPGIVVMILAEVAVPVCAQSAGMTPWHPHHIAERYELFTLIVLGESVAAATVAVRSAFDRRHDTGSLYVLAAGGLLMAYAMWWLYFARPAHTLLATTHRSHRRRFPWAYGRYLIFASGDRRGRRSGRVRRSRHASYRDLTGFRRRRGHRSGGRFPDHGLDGAPAATPTERGRAHSVSPRRGRCPGGRLVAGTRARRRCGADEPGRGGHGAAPVTGAGRPALTHDERAARTDAGKGVRPRGPASRPSV
ncbi:low temperature requirement protein A [Streptomyces camelliae]|uniref:Low temperature requirement protein A n=1 Tax=Streptomyces camelliae TaxID=3004093 RepID=A0ABY7PDT2_9ACTN|nr:low temperature requirement protein A [Streptomyces sp. HUAS 2-6]WBO68783.1 low temperature requirement protein A [Streptomyces sp. HUAS 2-6]